MPQLDQIATKTAPTTTGPRSAFFTQTTPGTSMGGKLTLLEILNIALRGLMEAGIVAALGIWGYHTGVRQVAKVSLAILAPALGFGFWGAVDFHQAGKLAEPLRLIQELAISMLAAAALLVTGLQAWALALLALSTMHHVLVYALGQRLITGHRLQGFARARRHPGLCALDLPGGGWRRSRINGQAGA